jgi:eukaryotic-like serine/threonine-protein kinase
MPADPNHVKSIFLAAVAKRPEERAAFLDSACGDDKELRQRAEELLRSHDEPGGLPGVPDGDEPATTATFPESATGGLIGPYKLLQRLGEGGMGEVWMAEQMQPVQRKVALKIIKPGMDSRQVVARFEAERQALALMDHQNIARVFDGGETTDGRPYFVMELVRGVPITRYCDEHRLSPRERLDLFVPVCQAVQHAHQKGIIHRDLKPSNVLVAPYDGKPVVKVIDFGVAKAAGQRLTDKTLFTEFGSVIGTLEYMSPEQAELNNQDIDTRSDIYSLGVLLYELLTGTTPLTRDRLKEAAFAEMLRFIREEEPPKPSTRLSASNELPLIAANRSLDPKRLSGQIRGELDWIVMKALEKDRNRRYDTANNLALDLQRYLADEPVQACAPSLRYRLRKFARRHRTALGAAAVMTLTLLLTLVALAFGFVEVRRALADRSQAYARLEGEEQKTKDALTDVTRLFKDVQREQKQTEHAWYLQSIALADREWGLNNVIKVKEILERCPSEHRGWEWHYLNSRNHKELLLIGGGGKPFVAVAFSPNGKLLATSGADIKLWDADTGQEVRTLVSGTIGSSFGGSLSFSTDGARLAATLPIKMGADRGVRIWEVATGKELLTIPAAQVRTFVGVAFSPDGKRIATSDAGKLDKIKGAGFKVQVWDAESGVELLSMPAHTNDHCNVSFHPDGQSIAAGGFLWDAATGQLIRRMGTLGKWIEPPKKLPIAPKIIFPPLTNGQSVAFGGKGAFIAGGSRGSLIRICDTRTGDIRCTIDSSIDEDVDIAPDSIFCMAFSPNGSRLASPGNNNTVKLHMLTGALVTTIRGHSGAIRGLAFHPDNRRLATASADSTVRIWDVSSVQDMLPRPPSLEGAKAYSPTANRCAGLRAYREGADMKWELRVWDFKSDRETFAVTTQTPLSRIAFSHDGEFLAAAADSEQRTLIVWDATTGRRLIDLRRDDRILQFGFGQSPRHLIVLNSDRTFELLDVTTGQVVLRRNNFAPSSFPQLSPDGKRLAVRHSGSAKQLGGMDIWDATTGKRLLVLRGHYDIVTSVAFSPDSERVISTSFDKTIKIWDLKTGTEVRTLSGHTGPVRAAAFSPDARRLVSCCDDKTLKIWDPESGREILTLRNNAALRSELAFSADGHRIVCGMIWNGTPLENARAVAPKAATRED